MIRRFLGALVLAAVSTAAYAVDSKNFVITMQEGLTPSQEQACVETIQDASSRFGNGESSYFPGFGIVVANLTDAAAQDVATLDCVLAVEEEGVVDAAPRVGRGN